MASKSELEAVIKLAGSVSPSLRKSLHDANQQFNNLGNTSSHVGKLMSSAFSFAAKGVAIGSAAIGTGLLLAAKQGLDLASDLQEVQNVVDVTFGGNAKKIDAWSKTTLESYGLAELSAKQYSSTFGALMKSSGVSSDQLLTMSENLTALTGDFASFKNLDPAEAFEKLRSGINGETEPMLDLGINMSVANLQAYALSKGITTSYDKMDQASKTLLRYNYILANSTDAQGDFARTYDGYANQVRLFKERWKDLSKTIMTNTLPALNNLMHKGNELIKSFANSPEKIAKLQATIGGIADKVIVFIPIAVSHVKDFVGTLGQLYDGAVKVYQFISDNWSTIKPLLLGIVGAMLLWKGLVSGIAVYETVMKAISISTKLAAAAQWLFNTAILANPITWIVIGIAAAIAGLIVGFYYLYKNWDQVQAFLSNSWTNIKNAFAIGINWIVDKINWLTEKMNKIPGVDISLIPKMDTSAYDAATQLQSKGGSSSFQKFDVASQAQSSGGSTYQKFARGGFANQPSIFGEAGPEAAIPLKRTPRSLSLLNQTSRAIGADEGGKSPTFVFAPNYNGDSSSAKRDLKEAGDEFFDRCDRWWESKRRESFA